MPADNTGFLLLWVIVCVVLITGLAYWFTRFVVGRSGRAGFGAAHSAVQIRVLSRTPIGKEQNLLLVEVDQRYFLLGAAPGGICAIAEFSQEETKAWKEDPGAPESRQTMDFKHAIQTVMKQRGQR